MSTNTIEDQIELEQLFNKNQTIKRLVKEYNIKPIQNIASKANLDINFVLHMLAHICIHKQANISTMVGLLKNHFNSLQECADALYKAAEYDLINWYSEREMFGENIPMKSSVMEEINKYQFPLPLIIPPKKVKRNKDTGYYSEFTEYGSIILNGQYHENDVNLDHINRINSVKLSINSAIAHKIKNNWKNINAKKNGESDNDYKKRLKNFHKYNQATYDIINGMVMLGNCIYISNKYDKRGRCYAVGYHINPQGNCWNKATIEFYNKEKITDTY